MLTNGQKRALHSAARQAGVDEPQRRLIQRNVGGFHSAADGTASREGFVAVMAFYESCCDGCLKGSTSGYWSDESVKVNPTDRLLWKVRDLSARLGWDAATLDSFVAGPHMTSGRYQAVGELPAFWLRKVVEGLKAMTKKAGNRQQAIGNRQ